MSFRDDLLADIDAIRGIPGELGLHRYQVYTQKTVWAGSRPGFGSRSVIETRVLVGGQDPHVREIRSNDIVAGADDLQYVEFEIGPLAPDTISTLDPAQDGQPTTVAWLIKGPGLPSTGLLCSKVSDDVGKPFRTMIKVKSMGRKA